MSSDVETSRDRLVKRISKSATGFLDFATLRSE
jgi:hypothetical protein